MPRRRRRTRANTENVVLKRKFQPFKAAETKFENSGFVLPELL
jgi:hypothetical protein